MVPGRTSLSLLADSYLGWRLASEHQPAHGSSCPSSHSSIKKALCRCFAKPVFAEGRKAKPGAMSQGQQSCRRDVSQHPAEVSCRERAGVAQQSTRALKSDRALWCSTHGSLDLSKTHLPPLCRAHWPHCLLLPTTGLPSSPGTRFLCLQHHTNKKLSGKLKKAQDAMQRNCVAEARKSSKGLPLQHSHTCSHILTWLMCFSTKTTT